MQMTIGRTPDKLKGLQNELYEEKMTWICDYRQNLPVKRPKMRSWQTQ